MSGAELLVMFMNCKQPKSLRSSFLSTHAHLHDPYIFTSPLLSFGLGWSLFRGDT
jgi:hypothetical protein